MTENETVILLSQMYLPSFDEEEKQALSKAIKALQEIQQYRAIGTVEECREAIEKQRPKKPIKISPCKSVNYYKCSSCGEFLGINKPFCEECGNAVDWSDTD